MQFSGLSHGQYSRWCTAAEPKSHSTSSPVRVYSAYRHSLSLVHSVAAEPGEVDPLLEVDVHPARRRGEGTIRHAGLLGSCTSARAPQSKDLCSVAVKPARSWCAV